MYKFTWQLTKKGEYDRNCALITCWRRHAPSSGTKVNYQCDVLSFLGLSWDSLPTKDTVLVLLGPNVLVSYCLTFVWKTQPNSIGQPSQTCSANGPSNLSGWEWPSLNPTQATRPSWWADSRITWRKPSGMWLVSDRRQMRQSTKCSQT